MKTTKSVGHAQIDRVSGKTITHYGEDSLFIIYVKRHNGARKILKIGNGNQLQEILESYHGCAVYMSDRKYLCHRRTDQPVIEETKVLTETGKGHIRDVKARPGRKGIDFVAGELSCMHNVPMSIITGLDAFTKKGHIINSQHLTKTKLICVLLAEFLYLSDDGRIKFLTSGDLLLEKHKLMCGGVSEERIQKTEAHEETCSGDFL